MNDNPLNKYLDSDRAALIALVADAEETAVWQWKRELEALGDVTPPETPPVVDDDAE